MGYVYKVGPSGSYVDDIAIDRDGNIYTASLNHLYKTNPHTGKVDVSLGLSHFSEYQMPGPKRIAFDSENNIYTANTHWSSMNNNRTYYHGNITKITQKGVVSVIGPIGAIGGNGPLGLAIDSQDNVYVTLNDTGAITKITKEGQISRFGTTVGTGYFKLAIDSKDNLYIANYYSASVTKITKEGVSTYFGRAGSGPFYIAIDSFDNIYVTNPTPNTVTRITQTGQSTTFANTGQGPIGIAIDSNDSVYTANWETSNVTKIAQRAKIAPGNYPSTGIPSLFGNTRNRTYFLAIDRENSIYTSDSNGISELWKIIAH